jgi:uncharacterized membrane protein YadS
MSNFFSKKLLLFGIFFFGFNLIFKKFIFQEQITLTSISGSLITTIMVVLLYAFLQRKKTSSKDN